MNNKKAFTLIEILIVVAIFATLASVILASIGKTARERAHDAKEISHIEQMSSALEAYYQFHNEFPYEQSVPPFQSCGMGTYNGERVCVDCSDSLSPDFFEQLVDEGFLTNDAIARMFGYGPDGPDPRLNMCYFYTEDLQYYLLVSRLYNDDKEAYDGGWDWFNYEVGNALDMPYSVTDEQMGE